MGIPVQDDPTADTCTLCFDVDETPLVLWATVTGIKIGDTWSPSDGDAPNGVFKLHLDSGCSWTASIGRDTLLYFTTSAESHFSITRDATFNPFSKFISPKCTFAMPSAFTTPGAKNFYSGQVALSWTTPAEGSSLLVPADLVQIPKDPKTFAEVFPFSSTENVYRYARKKDATLAKIKFDFTV